MKTEATPTLSHRHPSRRILLYSALAALALPWAGAARAGHVTWFSEESGSLFFAEREDVDSPEAAVYELLAGPSPSERAAGVVTAIPDGVGLRGLQIMDDGVVIDLSAEAAEGLTDERSETIFRQFLYTMSQFGLDTRVHVLVEGRLLSDYLPPAPPALYLAPADAPGEDPYRPKAAGLAGKRISMSAGHGYVYGGTSWNTQRGIVCGNPQEDFRNLRLARYLRVFLENDGAYVQHVREHDLNRGNGPSGHPWWQQAAYAYLRDQSYACNVYASLSGTCSYTGANHRDDDIRARPLASNLDTRGNTDIFLSIHTNAFQGACYSGCPSGTGTYYMDQGEHETWGAASRTLAGHITLAVVAAAKEADERRGDGAEWQCHGTCAAKYGNFGEIRIPHRPAALIELGFHDSCNTDAPVMEEPFFQSVTMWGMYKGVCDYFGNTPTWPLYSAQMVSTNIPQSMTVGESIQAEIIVRNKSVLWHRDYGFKLAAGGDADPFAAARHELGSATVDNNGTHTFRFTFTAPATPGSYQTTWQMLRESHRRFGEVLTRTVQVLPVEDPCECEPGEIEEGPCGECGVWSRTCGEDCKWRAYGPCETNDVGSVCETGLAGPCTFGLWTCEGDQIRCVSQVVPQQELCDGIDNSCSGAIDDGFPSELGDPPPAFAAELVDASFPAALAMGESATVTVSFRNVGHESWPAGRMALLHLGPEDPEQPVFGGPWSQTGIAAFVSQSVAPGESAALEFRVTAPSTAGPVTGTFQLLSSDAGLIACPQPLVLVEVEVDGEAVIPPDEDPDRHFYVTGGCGCEVGTPALPGVFGLLWPLFLLLTLRSRRRSAPVAGSR